MTYHRDRPEPPQAACSKLDPRTADELFFASPLSVEAREARRICATCPMVLQCREYADTHEVIEYPSGHVAVGVWGGETADERKARRANRPSKQVKIDRLADEEETWSVSEACRAAVAARNGDRSEWALTGRRIYDRRTRRAARERRRAAA